MIKCVLGARRSLTFPVNVAFAPELARASVRLDVEAEEGRIASQQKRWRADEDPSDGGFEVNQLQYPDMTWWRDARFGMFIRWGLYWEGC